MEQLFFELIRAAIGSQDTLSIPPSKGEWAELYAMAKKQSLVGICFAAVQKLTNNQEPITKNLDEVQYLTWMGMAAKIQQRNDTMKAKGDVLLAELRNKGMDACILKGQALAHFYADLAMLRQSGDIDVWVKNKSVMELDAYVKELGLTPHTTAAHVSYEDKDGVEIELHATPAFMRDFRTNRNLVKWFKEFNGSTTEFNLVYMMVHMYHHVLFEGLGLRQLMDYYFVLRAANKEVSDGSKLVAEPVELQEVSSTIESLGMKKFASGILWVIDYVFGDLKLSGTAQRAMKPSETLPLSSNEKVGKLLLDEIMSGGNFGHYDERDKNIHHGNALVRTFGYMKRNLKFFSLGPAEVLSSPLWSLWHWRWRKKHGLI